MKHIVAFASPTETYCYFNYFQIIQGKLYRERDCHFPARCTGIEYYLKSLAKKMPDMELAINTRDWPQLNRAWGQPKAPVLSFSKVFITMVTYFIIQVFIIFCLAKLDRMIYEEHQNKNCSSIFD